ncbi:hypothetical protein F4775DRAFT_144506 [Biscogniauxia sp. FL1348]|nr:hypothetical protein F4775DRAFT_144506 [Biscogniauxia sp. FL1348]
METVPDKVQPSISSPLGAPGVPTAPVKRRAPIACRRCRRMRSKCIHDKAPPCKSCKEANVPEECVFPSRGDADQDRQFRHPRQRADRKSKGDIVRVKKESAVSPALLHNALVDLKPPKVANEWDLLPSLDIVLDNIDTFTKHFYQLGFVPKKTFPKGLRENPESMSVFLLLSMLCISARFNNYFIKTYGDGLKPATEFMQRAQRLAIHELYQEPTLERCQAFYLLSIAEQGSGKSNTSYISAGIAFRMAALMRLHREEAYSLITAKSPLEHRVRAESARRTFWMLHSQDNLHSGPYKPVSLAASDITALLPCDEADFDAGRIPERRAALEGTPPAIQNPSLVSLNPRSLFASLMQVHNYWGIIARRVLCNEKDWRPADEDSDYARLNQRLKDWERNLPSEHGFGKILLGGYRHYTEDLAYLSLTGCLRLCHMVLRKAYLDEMLRHAHRSPSNPETRFYQNMASELFCNVRLLYEQIDSHFENGTPIESLGSQMAAFTVYSCGLFASYLCKFPQLDAQHVGNDLQAAQDEGRMIYSRSLTILRAYQTTWPLAETWCNGLEKWYSDANPKRISFQAGTMTDGKEPQPYALGAMHPRITPTAFSNPAAKFQAKCATPPSRQADDRRRAKPAPEAEAPRLAPLQHGQPSYVEPVCLPPLSQAQYVSHPQHQATTTTPQPSPPSLQAPPPQQQQQQPPPPPTPTPPHQQHSYQQQHPAPYPPHPNHPSGLDVLLEASSGATPPPMGPCHHQHPGAYYAAAAEYTALSSLNDGFDSNLQVLVDGGAQWTATDATAAIYNPYGFLAPQP